MVQFKLFGNNNDSYMKSRYKVIAIKIRFMLQWHRIGTITSNKQYNNCIMYNVYIYI